jgi:prevent-host-death family protein
MAKKVSALKARRNLGQLLESVYYRGDQYIIERAGRPMAAVVPLWQLEAWQNRSDRFFAAIDEVRERSDDVDPGAIEGEVSMAVRAVRKRPKRRKV